MKIIQYIILLVFASVLAVSCGEPENGRIPQISDTIYTDKAAWLAYYENPERARTIVDSAEILGNLTSQQADILRARFFCSDESTMDTARRLCKHLLSEGGLKVEQRTEVLEVLVYVARIRKDDEDLLKYGMQYIGVCRQLGNETEALVTQSEIGSALIRLGRTDEGFAKMNDAIAQLDRVRRFAEMDACVRALKRKISSLITLDRYEEVLTVAGHILEKMNDYGEHPADYNDGSEHMPTDERRPGYIDFCSGQAYAFQAYAYTMVNQIAEARKALRLFDQTDYSKTFNGKKLISSVWCELGEYDKMLAFYDELERLWGADTLHNDYAVMLRNRAVAASARDNYQAGYGYMSRYSDLMQHLNDSERLASVQEYAARYHEQEQQLALEKEQASRKRMGTMVVFLGIIVLTAVVFLVITLRQMFSIRLKNAVLSKEIEKHIAYEEKYLQLMEAERSKVKGETDDAPQKPELSPLEELTDSELFDYIRKVVSGENLHLDPQFGRDQLMERLHLSKERIGAAFSQGSDYGNISNFLNDARLFHSTKLLTEHPEMPIAEVAAASGFSNRIVFSRNFKERFAMTPSEFREKKK